MVVLDATVVNIALPSAQHDLGFNNADRQWVVTAYSLAFGGLLLLGGRLADLVGRKRMLIIGMIGFACASALGGAAQNFTMLLIARAIQGAFGALLAPAALSTLTVTFTNPAERGKAFGIFGAIAGAGGAVGLLLGGVLTEYLSWRWCLYVNVIFSVVAVAAAIRLLSRDRRDPSVHLDVPGTVLVVAGLVAFVYGLSEADTKGWGDPLTIGLLVGGVILLALFVLTERRVAHPLLPLRIILDRFRGGAYLSIGLSAIGLFGVFLFLTYYLEEILRYSPVVTGVAFLPLIGALIVSSTISSQLLMPKFGPRILIPAGLLLAAGGMVILASQLGVATNYAAWILPGAGRHRPRARAGVRLRAEHRHLRRRRRPTPGWRRPWSTPASRSAARSAPRCSTPSPPARCRATWSRTAPARPPRPERPCTATWSRSGCRPRSSPAPPSCARWCCGRGVLIAEPGAPLPPSPERRPVKNIQIRA